MTQATAQPTDFSVPPPEAPRALTRQAARRSWCEMRVRIWWMMALALALIAGWFVATQLLRSAVNSQLIRNGTPVRAEILSANGNILKNKLYEPSAKVVFGMRYVLPGKGIEASVGPRPTESQIRLAEPLPADAGDLKDQYIVFTSGPFAGAARRIVQHEAGSGLITFDNTLARAPEPGDRLQIQQNLRQHTITSRLQDQRESTGPGAFVSLHIDPDDPSQWTDRQASTFVHDLLVGLMLAPAVGGLLLFAILARRRVLRVWRYGQPTLGTVVGVGQTAIAPMSRLVRFTLEGRGNSRVYAALVPARCAGLRRGEPIWLVVPPGKPQRAIVAALYA